MEKNPILLTILIVGGLLGIGGVFANRRWARILFWVLALPPFCLGVLCLLVCWLVKGVPVGFLLFCCAGLFLPFFGCLVGSYATRLRVPVVTFTEFYLAYSDAAVSYDTAPRLFPERAEHKWIGTEEVARLWAVLLQARGDAVMMIPYFPCLLSKEASKRFIYRLPDELVADFSRITHARVASLSKKWEEAVGRGRGSRRINYRRALIDLARLSRLAVENGQSVYLWTCETIARDPHKRQFLGRA